MCYKDLTKFSLARNLGIFVLHGTETRHKMAYKSYPYLSIVDCRQLPGKYIDLEEMRLLAIRGKLQGQKGRETFMYRKVLGLSAYHGYI